MTALRTQPRPGSDQNALPTILVVEDEVIVRLSISDELRNGGFNVLEAANADEALRVFQSPEAVDLVFTDVQMPGTVDGMALVKWLRQERPDVKVVITSAHLVASSAHASISKPYSPFRVIKAIRNLLGLQEPKRG